MKEIFEVMKVGIQLTIQDAGRKDFRHLGIPVSGAMDQYAFQIGNILVGNSRRKASLEVAIGGTILKSLQNFNIAITGGDLSPHINNKKAEMWKVLTIKKGDILSFKGAETGVYSYISIPGGIESQYDLKSQSSYGKASLGMNIHNGSIIASVSPILKSYKIGLNARCIPLYPEKQIARFIKSSHYKIFPNEVISSVQNNYSKVGSCNRMGMYLHSDIQLNDSINTNILSEGTTFGTIQILPSGQPIVLLADSQTTGGYATLGSIIYSDLWKIAQLKQGSLIQLIPININEAANLNKNFERFLSSLENERKNIVKELE